MRSETNIPPEGEVGRIEASTHTPEAGLSIKQRLEGLLLKGETEVPEAVINCAERLQELGIWHQFSRNHTATSCRDAAHKRNRLGHEGIPLWDELKSYLAAVESRDWQNASKTHFVLAHCRGDREFDLKKVGQTIQGSHHITEHLGGLGMPIDNIRIANQEEAGQFGVEYGLVNPFLAPKSMVHLFDRELGKSFGPPGTVMTNAGDRTWGVEVDIKAIVNHPVKEFGDKIIFKAGDLVAPQVEKVESKDVWGVRGPRKTIGILTGNPPRSGFELCELMGEEIQRSLGPNSLGDISMPPTLIRSVPEIGISMEIAARQEALRRIMIKEVRRLCNEGADIIVHPAHTSSAFAEEMKNAARQLKVEFISIADTLGVYLEKSGINEFALLGTKFVTDLSRKGNIYEKVFAGKTVHIPPDYIYEKINELAFEVQQHGATPQALNSLADILRKGIPEGCANVVLAMTEFTPVANKLKASGRQGKILIDPMKIYAEAIARKYLGLEA
jgi:aspartate/glutamate racemase